MEGLTEYHTLFLIWDSIMYGVQRHRCSFSFLDTPWIFGSPMVLWLRTYTYLI